MNWQNRTQPVKVGDTVAYSKAFLQSISAYTGDLPQARGKVAALISVGKGVTEARYAPEPAACLRCRANARCAGTVYRHGTASLCVRDVPRDGRPVAVCVRRRRYHCRVCNRTFLQPLSGICSQARVTKALAAYVRKQAGRKTVGEVARLIGVDEKPSVTASPVNLPAPDEAAVARQG